MGVALVALLLAASAPPAAKLVRLDGSTLGTDEADSFIQRQMHGSHVTGLAVAVLNRGQVVYLRAFGERDSERHLPLQTDTVMYGASFTKAVFGTLVAQLAEEKVIDLDQPVQTYLKKPLPEYPKYADLAGDERYKRITARMLLSHTAGFANFRALEEDGKLHIHFEPGTRYAYSGEGINLLQMVLEEKLGRPIAELLRERIFVPLGMEHTSLRWQPQFEANTANGYDKDGKSLGHDRRENARAAGSMDTTIADFAKFLSAVMGGKWPSANAKKRMLWPAIAITYEHQFPTFQMRPTQINDRVGLSYGLGWGLLMRTPYGVGYFKEGHDDGWGNYALAFDASGTGVILMSNSSNGETIFKPVLEKLIHDDVTPWEWELYPQTQAK